MTTDEYDPRSLMLEPAAGMADPCKKIAASMGLTGGIRVYWRRINEATKYEIYDTTGGQKVGLGSWPEDKSPFFFADMRSQAKAGQVVTYSLEITYHANGSGPQPKHIDSIGGYAKPNGK